MAKKYVYFFGGSKAEGSAKMRELLGGKGSNLAEMTSMGIRVPAGFTISTEVCNEYYQNKENYPPELDKQVRENIKKVEKAMGAKFGDKEDPLLLSVRSGARVSMPGMMDTVLNLGLNDTTIEGLVKKSGDRRFAYDCYRRFVQMYGDVVLGLKPEEKEEDYFEVLIEKKKKDRGVKLDTELTADDLEDLVRQFREMIHEKTGAEFPDDPYQQLWGAITAVFGSWNNRRAIEYRKINKIPDHWGTAVNVQSMVYGNLGDDSATGVAFTRDPASGEKRFYGEFLVNAQGEDVVAGIRTPRPINRESKKDDKLVSLEEEMPGVYRELEEVYQKLEGHFREMQDLEFTIQQGSLYLLQTRTGKRTGFAAVRIAVEMVEEGLISKEEAVLRVAPEQLVQLMAPVFDQEEKFKAIKGNRLLAKGLNASPGAASGKVVFSAEDAIARAGEKTILVRLETSPEDIGGMNVAQGVLTARGGMTSHAAVVARGMGKPCVAGCGELDINYAKKEFVVRGESVREGDYISIDGIGGEVIKGELKTYPSEIVQVLVNGTMKKEDSLLAQQFLALMSWADDVRRLGVRTNADTPRDARVARGFGAEGIGLCRTEHMFFGGNRIDSVREMILAEDLDGRRKALEKLLPMQREDFVGIFKEMDGLPVIIRLLDPPLHEFLPHKDEEIEEIARTLGVTPEKLQAKVVSLQEYNPMLGHRGCRLGISYPEITEMQARAIFEAAVEVSKAGIKVIPEVMVPLVGDVREFVNQKEVIVRVAEEVMRDSGLSKADGFKYMVGTMIEVPRAALTASAIAREAEFFSYGTNDLTQMCFGFSRDDADKFLPGYVERGILPAPPFQTIDREGVGELIRMGIEKGKAAKEDLEVGICGEHGGDPASVEFCHQVGMDYVSCSPYRVPIARLAAAQAVLKQRK
ncbi:MAG: pyruvate, phosphate dikinase [Deltaproteobacteria bacterium]|nr:MAG: pyruvate, phosphate dikinase [Deltaproteobacteria bacterium]